MQDCERLRDKMVEHEAVLLDAIEYNFNVEQPYKHLRPILQKVLGPEYLNLTSDQHKHFPESKVITQAWYYVNDSFVTTLCLRHSPLVLGVTCLYLSMASHAKDLTAYPALVAKPSGAEAKPWYCKLYGDDMAVIKGALVLACLGC